MAFSCNICINDRPQSKRCECPTCGYEVCVVCQKAYGQPSCMACRQLFTRTFCRLTLGKSYLDTIYRAHVQEELLNAEKNLLAQTQPFVEYEKQRAHELSRARFGQRPNLPPLPVLQNNQGAVITEFPCPADNCRGFVTDDHCGVCNRRVCLTCRSVWTEDHVCDIADMASIAFVNSDTKNCPRCAIPIHRSSGCNHMKCTNCNCHFDWMTMQILQGSTNHHYDNTPRFTNDASVIPGRHSRNQCDDEDIVGLLSDRIPREQQRLGQDYDSLLKAVYDDAEDVRCVKRSLFNERLQAQKHMQKMIRLRIDFLTGKMDEAKWARKIYDTKKMREKEIHVGGIINMYLVTVRQVQLQLFQKPESAEPIRADWLAFLKLSNQSLKAIQDDYGGKQMLFKADLQADESPALSL